MSRRMSRSNFERNLQDTEWSEICTNDRPTDVELVQRPKKSDNGWFPLVPFPGAHSLRCDLERSTAAVFAEAAGHPK